MKGEKGGNTMVLMKKGEDEKRTLVIDKTVKGDNKKWYNGKKILKSYVNQGLILVASH